MPDEKEIGSVILKIDKLELSLEPDVVDEVSLLLDRQYRYKNVVGRSPEVFKIIRDFGKKEERHED